MNTATTTANLSHDHNTSGERTLREWADITGRKPDSVMKTVRRKLGNGHNLDTPMTADQFSGLFAAKPTPALAAPAQHRETKASTNHTHHPKPATAATRTAQVGYRRMILYVLMAMPAAASIQNMYTVSADIAEHRFTALLLTGLFSATPFLFVLAGMRNDWTKALAGVMIAYECFSNVTRIYGGLTGFGRGDFPTRFLGLVCDFFNFGTYATAKALAIIMAAMAAAVFYAAFVELQKNR